VHFLHHALLDDGDARLLRRDVDRISSVKPASREIHQGDAKFRIRGFAAGPQIPE
jgi:hypothetical protein